MLAAKNVILFFCFLLLYEVVAAQVTQREGSIFMEVTQIIDDMPGDSGDDYSEPVNTQLDVWENVLNNLFLEEFVSAASDAEILD